MLHCWEHAGFYVRAEHDHAEMGEKNPNTPNDEKKILTDPMAGKSGISHSSA